MGLTKEKREIINNDEHFKMLNAQITGQKTQNYDPLMDGQRNLDADAYKNKASNLSISGKQLFKEVTPDFETDVVVGERQIIAEEIKNSRTYRSEKTRKSHMADAAKAAKNAGIAATNLQNSQNSMSRFEIYQANTKINLSHYEMQKNYAKAITKSRDMRVLLIENAQRAFLIKEIGDILEAKKWKLSPGENKKINASLKKAVKEYTKILVKAGELKKEDAVLYELNPQLIFEEIGVKKELKSNPDAADDMGVDLCDLIEKMDSMSDEEVLKGFEHITKVYLYSKYARKNAMLVDDEINRSTKGAIFERKLSELEKFFARAAKLKARSKMTNENHKEAVKTVDAVDSHIVDIQKELEREVNENHGKEEELKKEHFHNIMRFNLDSFVNLSDDDLLLKYDELKKLAAIGRMYGGYSLGNSEFDNYIYKRQNIRTRMEVVETLCARASLLRDQKDPQDPEVKATQIKLNKLAKRYGIYKREFLRRVLKDTEFDTINDYIPDSELRVPKDILAKEKEYTNTEKTINDAINEYNQRKKEGASATELSLLEYVITQKSHRYHPAGGVKTTEGFKNDNMVAPEPLFRGGVKQLFKTPVFKDINEEEIRKFIFDISAGVTLPTYEEVDAMTISEKEKADIRKEIDEARKRNFSALTTLMETTDQFYNYVASIFGTDVLSPEFCIIHKKDFNSLISMGQLLTNLLENQAIRDLIGERGEILKRKADFLHAVGSHTVAYVIKPAELHLTGDNPNVEEYDNTLNFGYKSLFVYPDFKDNLSTMLGKERYS